MGKKSWLKSVRNVFKSSPSSKDSDKRVEWSSSEVAEEGEMPETVSVEHFPADTSVDGEADEEEREHAMVAAVEAAAVAARAAARVVRLAGYGRLSREDNAAVIVQSCYRGYLARKARRALRGLVRLQALVRGHAVRKQARMTMRCMQSLVRIQARARAQRLSLMHNHTYEYLPCRRKRLYPPMKDPCTIKEEEVDDDDGDDGGTYRTGNNKCPHIEDRQGIVMESQRRHDNVVDQERALAYAFSCRERPQWGWNWLERWVTDEHDQLQSHDRSASLPESSYAAVPKAADNMSEKTVEIDTEPKKFSKRQFTRHEEAEERLTRMQHAVPSYMAATQSAKEKARAHIGADGQRRAQSARPQSGYSLDSSCGGDDRTPPFVGGMMGRKERGGV